MNPPFDQGAKHLLKALELKLVVGDFVQGIVDICDCEIRAGLKLIDEWNAIAQLVKQKVTGINDKIGNYPILKLIMARENIA